MTNSLNNHATVVLTIVASFLPPIATFFVVWATKTEGKRNHLANRQLIESNRHLINLQYRANVYRDVIQFMAVNRHRIIRRYLRSQEPELVKVTDQDRSHEINRDELSVFVALELHASAIALAAYFKWDDALTACLDSMVEDSDVIQRRISELDRLEKSFLETVKQEVAL